MRQPTHTIELFCDIDGTKIGEAQTFQPMTAQEYRTLNGFVDMRCSNCEATHGTFNELALEYQKETHDDAQKAEAFVIKNRKRSDFDVALEDELDKRKSKLGDIIN